MRVKKIYEKQIPVSDISACGNDGKEAKEMAINRSYDTQSLDANFSCLRG